MKSGGKAGRKWCEGRGQWDMVSTCDSGRKTISITFSMILSISGDGFMVAEEKDSHPICTKRVLS